MDRMYEKLTMEQNYIQKMKPSKAVKELEELHSNAELMLARTDTVFEEAYHRKYVEFLQSLNEAKKPEELTVEFCRDI